MVALIFFLSGFAGLVYQVVWQRVLTLYYGVGPVSIVIIVSVYMLGLGLGSLLGGHLAEKVKGKCGLYSGIEALLGAFGFASLAIISLIGRHTAGCSFAMSLFYISLFLVIPTLLMGMTLPVLVKLYTPICGNYLYSSLLRGDRLDALNDSKITNDSGEARPTLHLSHAVRAPVRCAHRDGASPLTPAKKASKACLFDHRVNAYLYSLSRLYFINTLGAAVGALAASYGIITYLGMDRGVMIAASLNLSLALAVFLLRNQFASADPAQAPRQNAPESKQAFMKTACILVFIAGFLAIGYEVLWYRLIGVLIKDSPYAFSSILAVYLLGIALGSRGVRVFQNRSHREKREIYYQLQCLLSISVLALVVGYFYLTKHTSLGYFTRLSFANDLHPPSILPAFHSWQEGLQSLYAMTDVFLWPLFFMLIPTLCMGASLPLASSLALSGNDEGNTTGTIYFFNTLGNVTGGLVTGFLLIPMLGTEKTFLLFIAAGLAFGLFIKSLHGIRFSAAARFLCFASTSVAAGLIFPKNGELYNVMHTDPFGGSECFFQEGLDSVVLTYQRQDKVRNYINGQGHGYRPGYLFYAESGEALRHAHSAANVLIIGFGAGSILELVLKSDLVRHVTIVELCESSIINLKKMPIYGQMLSDPRAQLVMDDGRRFLAANSTRYDLILMDPSRTTTAYSNNLNSLEFFTLARSRLTQKGILMAGGITDGHANITRTLVQAFPYVRDYGFFCLCSGSSLQINGEMSDGLAAALSPSVQRRLSPLVRFQGDQEQIREKTRGCPVNTDLRPYAEYYLKPGQK